MSESKPQREPTPSQKSPATRPSTTSERPRVAVQSAPRPAEVAGLKVFENKSDDLLRYVDELQSENQALRSQQANLMSERATLIEKSELARTRVEAMIARLRAMEIVP